MNFKRLSAYHSLNFRISEIMYFDGLSKAGARAKILMDDLQECHMRRKCKKEGHVMADNSYGGPESGAIGLYCKRCGWSHHVQLY